MCPPRHEVKGDSAMHDRKTKYLQERIEALESENIKLKDENAALKDQINKQKETIDAGKADVEKKLAAVEKLINEYSAIVKGAAEARDAYKRAIKDVYAIRAEAKKTMKKHIARIRKQK